MWLGIEKYTKINENAFKFSITRIKWYRKKEHERFFLKFLVTANLMVLLCFH